MHRFAGIVRAPFFPFQAFVVIIAPEAGDDFYRFFKMFGNFFQYPDQPEMDLEFFSAAAVAAADKVFMAEMFRKVSHICILSHIIVY